MKTQAIILSTLFIGILVSGCKPDVPADRAEALYAEYCQQCHGGSGEGDGQLAYLLYPKPRDFSSGLYKLRSTYDGQLPSDEDLFNTIRTGMLGTSMPSFEFLGDENIQLLVEYIKQFDEGFETEKRERITIPEKLPFSPRLVQIGKEAYRELGCHRCHGETGRGDGPSAFELKDGWGYPIYVRDFTRGFYIGGHQPEDLYFRFISGMSGTPMPSYESSLEFIADTEEELNELLWGLVYYVKDLEAEDARALRVDTPEEGIITAVNIDDETFRSLLDPFARYWDNAQVHYIPVSRLWQTIYDDANVVNVRAVYNDSQIAFHLEWRDETHDASTFRKQDFQDAAAIQFSLTDEPGFHGMGSKENPVDMWFWKASWQLLADKGKRPDIELAYANRASDADVPQYPDLIAEEYFLPGRMAKNILSIDDIFTTVENMNAIGPETVTSKPTPNQNVTGKGVWDGEKWRVVFVRDLHTAEGTDVQFSTENMYWTSFAVWDGAMGDRDGLKKVSTWYRLSFE